MRPDLRYRAGAVRWIETRKVSTASRPCNQASSMMTRVWEPFSAVKSASEIEALASFGNEAGILGGLTRLARRLGNRPRIRPLPDRSGSGGPRPALPACSQSSGASR